MPPPRSRTVDDDPTLEERRRRAMVRREVNRQLHQLWQRARREQAATRQSSTPQPADNQTVVGPGGVHLRRRKTRTIPTAIRGVRLTLPSTNYRGKRQHNHHKRRAWKNRTALTDKRKRAMQRRRGRTELSTRLRINENKGIITLTGKPNEPRMSLNHYVKLPGTSRRGFTEMIIAHINVRTLKEKRM